MLKCKNALINYSRIIKKERTFEKVTHRMQAMLLRSKCLCEAFYNFKFIIKQFERRARAHSWNVFQHSKRKFVSLRGHVCPEPSASFHNYFSNPDLSCIADGQSANPSTYSLLWPDGSHRWVGSNRGKAKIIILSSSKKLKNKSKKLKRSREIPN